MKAAFWNRRKSANGQLANALERPSGDGECPTGMRAWGRRTAPRGFWVSLNGSGVASIPQFAAALRQRKIIT